MIIKITLKRQWKQPKTSEVSELNGVVFIKKIENTNNIISEEKRKVIYESSTELEDYPLSCYEYARINDILGSLDYKEKAEPKGDIDYYITFENIKYGIVENENATYIIKNVGTKNEVESIINESEYTEMKSEIIRGRKYYYRIIKGIVLEIIDTENNDNKVFYISGPQEDLPPSNLGYYKVSLENTIIRDITGTKISVENLRVGDKLNLVQVIERNELKHLVKLIPEPVNIISATLLDKDMELIDKNIRKIKYKTHEYELSDYDYAKLYNLLDVELNSKEYIDYYSDGKEDYIITTYFSKYAVSIDGDKINIVRNGYGKTITDEKFVTEMKQILEQTKES